MFRKTLQTVSRGCVLCGAAMVVAACTSADRPSIEAVTRDSAGIVIVENAAFSRATAEWRFVEPPVVELGALEGDPTHEFNQVVGATRLSDGRIAVADGGSKELRFFGTDGRRMWRGVTIASLSGRPGSGKSKCSALTVRSSD